MLEMNLQFFSHHKGGGSTANGRDSADVVSVRRLLMVQL